MVDLCLRLLFKYSGALERILVTWCEAAIIGKCIASPQKLPC